MNEQPPLFIKCECESEILEIQRYNCGDNDRGFNVAMWTHGKSSNKMCWRERLRWCWKILRTGDPWNDYAIVSDKNAMKISEYIQKTITE
jgi:hypothetical protein